MVKIRWLSLHTDRAKSKERLLTSEMGSEFVTSGRWKCKGVILDEWMEWSKFYSDRSDWRIALC